MNFFSVIILKYKSENLKEIFVFLLDYLNNSEDSPRKNWASKHCIALWISRLRKWILVVKESCILYQYVFQSCEDITTFSSRQWEPTAPTPTGYLNSTSNRKWKLIKKFHDISPLNATSQAYQREFSSVNEASGTYAGAFVLSQWKLSFLDTR